MMNEKISWRDVPLTSIETGTATAIGRNSAVRVLIMREYRLSGEIAGAFLATPEDLEEADDEDIADLGPDVCQIDWTGLDDASA